MKDSIIPYTFIRTMANISNIYEVRLMAWVIAKAQSVLKLYNKDLSDINLQFALEAVRVTFPARYLLQQGDTNYKNITKAFTLSGKHVEYEENNHVFKLNIIAFPEIIKKNNAIYVTFLMHQNIWRAFLDFSKGYRLIYLPAVLKLKSVYAVTMYFLISNQDKSITLTMEHLREMLGCENKPAYLRTNNFLRKVIDPAMKELDNSSPFTFRYGMKRTGRGGGYHNITIYPQRNDMLHIEPARDAKTQLMERQRIRLDEDVTEYIAESFEMKNKEIENIENLVIRLGDKQRQIAFLADVKTAANYAAAKNKAGYLVESLRNFKG